MGKDIRIEFEPELITCAICKEIFVSPRFLKNCYHSFCCECIDRVARWDGSVTCPICLRVTFLPEEGASQLQTNIYFREELLKEARTKLRKNCTIHNKKLDCVCLKCRVLGCSMCSEHVEQPKHELHLLSTVEAAMSSQVQKIDDSLGIHNQILEYLKRKTDAQSHHLRQQRDLLHAMVDEQFKKNSQDLWQISHKETKKISKKIKRLKAEHTKSKQLRHMWRRSIQDPSIESPVDIVERMHNRLNEDLGISPMEASAFSVTVPALECHVQTDDLTRTMKQFLGCPTQRLPLTERNEVPPIKDIRVPMRLGREVREILSVLPSSSGEEALICFRGDPPHLFCSLATVRAQDGTCLKIQENVVLGKGVCVCDYTKPEAFPFVVRMCKTGVFQVSKAVPSVCLQRDQCGTVSLHLMDISQHSLGDSESVSVHKPEVKKLLQHLDVVDPVSIDVSRKGNYYAIVDRLECVSKKQNLINGDSYENVVKLFRKGQRQPVDLYCATKPFFLPADVSFCHFGKKNLLLIADWQNDDIHVVHVKQNKFHFQRLLLEHHCDLVKPLALNTDQSGGVWVGCSNGALLRCTISD